MEMQAIMTVVQNLGAIGILALMVWKSPAILKVIMDLIQTSVNNVRDTQKEALAAFGGKVDQMMTLFSERFENIEKSQAASIVHLSHLVEALTELTGRVGALERADPK